MNLITTRSRIKSVVDEWSRTYGKGQYGEDKLIILEKLKLLDLNTTTAENIGCIIGNNSWTEIKCDECGKSVSCVIVLGEEPDYESATASICKKCLKKANKIINRTIKG